LIGFDIESYGIPEFVSGFRLLLAPENPSGILVPFSRPIQQPPMESKSETTTDYGLKWMESKPMDSIHSLELTESPANAEQLIKVTLPLISIDFNPVD
jgi:hypothetical protein